MPASPALAERVRSGEPRAIARAISLIEDDAAGAVPLIRALYPYAGRALLVGVTGPPGAGKSTLVDRLASAARKDGRTVGVIAVDPTSPFTGGAVLGDRVRMSAQAEDTGVFIRSMATRGHLGGLARSTADAAVVLDAAGKEIVIIETVGVGQGEIDIVRTADVTIVTLVPGTGDDVQALKAGVMEIADIFVVNKADRDGADRLAQAVTASLALKEAAAGEWQPPVLKTVATDGQGIAELWSAIATFQAAAAATAGERRRTRHHHRLRELLAAQLLAYVDTRIAPGEWQRALDEVSAHTTDPYTAVSELMRRAGLSVGDDTVLRR